MFFPVWIMFLCFGTIGRVHVTTASSWFGIGPTAWFGNADGNPPASSVDDLEATASNRTSSDTDRTTSKARSIGSGKTEEVNYWPTDGAGAVSGSGSSQRLKNAEEVPEVAVKEHDRNPISSSSNGNGWFSGSTPTSETGSAAAAAPGKLIPVFVADYESKDDRTVITTGTEHPVSIKEHDEPSANPSSGGTSSSDGQWFGFGAAAPPVVPSSDSGSSGDEDVWFGAADDRTSGGWLPVGSSSRRQQRRLILNSKSNSTPPKADDYEELDIITAAPESDRSSDVFTFVVKADVGGSPSPSASRPNVKVVSKQQDAVGGSTVLTLEEEPEIVTAAPSKNGWLHHPKEEPSSTTTTTAGPRMSSTSSPSTRPVVTITGTSTKKSISMRTSTGTLSASTATTARWPINRDFEINSTMDTGDGNFSYDVTIKSPSAFTSRSTESVNKANASSASNKVHVRQQDDDNDDDGNMIPSEVSTSTMATALSFVPWMPMPNKEYSNDKINASSGSSPALRVFYTPLKERVSTEVRDAGDRPNATAGPPQVNRESRNFNGVRIGDGNLNEGKQTLHSTTTTTTTTTTSSVPPPTTTIWSVAAAAAPGATRKILPTDLSGRTPSVSSEAISYILVGVCCVLSLVCLIAVMAVLRCRRVATDRRIQPPLPPPFSHVQVNSHQSGYVPYHATGHESTKPIAGRGWLDLGYGYSNKVRPDQGASDVTSSSDASKTRLWFAGGRKSSPYTLCGGYCGTSKAASGMDSSSCLAEQQMPLSVKSVDDVPTSGSPRSSALGGHRHQYHDTDVRHSSGLKSMNKEPWT